MAIRFEIVVNGDDPIIAGFTEKFYGMAATVSAAYYPDEHQDIGVNVGGLVRDTKKSITWLSQTLKPGDEIRIKIIEDVPITDPLQNPPPQVTTP